MKFLLTAAGTLLAAALVAQPLKLAMVTDGGTVEDHSFNQQLWEGLGRASKDFGADIRFLVPQGFNEAAFVPSMKTLADAGFQMLFLPGFKFETSAFRLQGERQDVKLVLLDGSPNNGLSEGDYQEGVAPNTVSIFFDEIQAGFLAGLAAALERKQGNFGCVGGMEIPPVQRYIAGFRQGVVYANENYGTNVVIEDRDVVYQGTFSNVEAGRRLAAEFHGRGVSVIFAVAGGVGWGVLQEAKIRSDLWVVGVDVDQFQEGMVPGTSRSVVLTSAIKRLDIAALTMVAALVNGRFPGGRILVFGARNNAVGLPARNPNLSSETLRTVEAVYQRLKSGELDLGSEAAP